MELLLDLVPASLEMELLLDLVPASLEMELLLDLVPASLEMELGVVLTTLLLIQQSCFVQVHFTTGNIR